MYSEKKHFPYLHVTMLIQHSRKEDIDQIFDLYRSAMQYQQLKGYNLWPLFEKDEILKEIEEQRHLKVLENNTIACVFSIQYGDPVIWKEKDKDPALYLHRIATHPDFKGRGMIDVVRDWSVEHARRLNKKFVRMDTWGNNKSIRDYYIRHGFTYLGQTFLDYSKGEKHYGGPELSLLQIQVNA